jgi:hypothetical protein
VRIVTEMLKFLKGKCVPVLKEAGGSKGHWTASRASKYACVHDFEVCEGNGDIAPLILNLGTG